ncbi:MAG: sigma-54 dependent transcriptional regulator [Chloroflexota bacterium]|nr:sigma-54 dependent transcriptional regulator [Chloroflexota bacterium]
MADHLLVVEDDCELLDLLTEVLIDAGYGVTPCPSGEAALRAIALGEPLDLVITDLRLPGLKGQHLLHYLREERPEISVVVLTAFGSIESAVELVKAGAYDYLTKPIGTAELLLTVERALADSQTRRLLAEQARSATTPIPSGFVAVSPQMRELLHVVQRVSRSRHSVLITGESGTGKELVARALHEWSGRVLFVPVNCSAIPETLMESELFGHEKGAFSGADRTTGGLFESADRGTLFLDEIGELPLQLQPKLLRALESGEVRRVGAAAPRKCDVRVIAATNRDLESEVGTGRFRQDLFRRLNVLHLEVPPLRERPADVLVLAERFLADAVASAQSNGAQPTVRRFSPDAVALLTSYCWPGNVRELRNAVQRAVTLSTTEEVCPSDLPPRVREAVTTTALVASASRRRLPLCEVERAYVLEVLRQTHGNKTQAAETLGLDRKTLYRKLEEYARDVRQTEGP